MIIEIWTNGNRVRRRWPWSRAPKILRKHLNPFIQYAEPRPGDRHGGGGRGDPGPATWVDQELERKLAMSLAELELSVRATNCLESEGITTVRDLVNRTDEELLGGPQTSARRRSREVKTENCRRRGPCSWA